MAAEVFVALPKEEELTLSESLAADFSMAIQSVQIDAANTRATAPEDKARISAIILRRHGSFDRINTIVTRGLLGLYLNYAIFQGGGGSDTATPQYPSDVKVTHSAAMAARED